jgi:exopolysaccharide biosynthesis predicted pyruvyltransferase EpsI
MRRPSAAPSPSSAARLRDTLSGEIERALAPLVAADTARICLIDPPFHENVGDSAILLGELDYVAKRAPNAHLSFYDRLSYSPFADPYISEADVILIHGGGNFGDLWPEHHRLRLQILDRFHDRRIVQLPQSIYFADQTPLAETARTIARQRDFTLMVRDAKSLAFARRHFECRVLLAPDMAFAMKPIVRRAAATDCFCLLRTDKEATADRTGIVQALRSAGYRFETGDWLNKPNTLTAAIDRQLGRVVSRRTRFMSRFRSGLTALRRRYADERVAYGIELLSRGSFVVADRLHAHILCCLLDIPNFVFDSLDGKISSFYATWIAGKRTSSWRCASPGEFAAKLDSSEFAR